MTVRSTTILRRFILLAFAAGLQLLVMLLLVFAAHATTYGGLGRVDESVITTGTEGNHGQVNTGGKQHGHAFVVDPETGHFFIADEYSTTIESKKKLFARVQEFSAGVGGAFLGEARIELRAEERVGGLTVDAKAGKVYLLVDEERPGESEIEEQIETKEEVLEKKREKHESTTQIETEINELKDKLPLFDSEQMAAAELWSLTVAVSKEELTTHRVLARSALAPDSETGKLPLLDPSGIAVDPVSHEIVITGQQDESPNKALEEGETAWHAAIQRVHENGKLGPRYVDGLNKPTVNCLDQGSEPEGHEPACLVDGQDFPGSPIVTSGGKLFVYEFSEIWESPASTGVTEEFSNVETIKEYDSLPSHLFSLEASLLPGAIHEEEGGAMSYVPVTSHTAGLREGRIYLDAKILENGKGSGIVQIGYTEPEVEGADKQREAQETGWTGGQTSAQPDCLLTSGGTTPVLLAAAANGEDVYALTTSAAAFAVWEYGPGGEACGAKPVVTSPNLETGKSKSEIGVGQSAKFVSQISESQATEVLWTIKHLHPELGELEIEEVKSGYSLQSELVLEHTFTVPGEYEVTETVKTDSLAFPTIVAGTAKITVTGIKIHLAPLESIAAEEEVAVKAKLEDAAETPAHITVVWKFGDGSAPVTKEYEGSPKEVELKHVFTKPGDYEISLEATDKSGVRHATAKIPVQVGESAAEKEAKRKAEEALKRKQEEEAAAAAAAKKQAEEAAKHKQEEEAAAAAKKQAEEAAAKKLQEEAEKKKREEEALSKKPLTRAQLLAKALKVCKKEPKKKRAKCEATARKKYGPKKKKK